MELCYHVEIDVNGEEIFMVNMEIIAAFSGRFSKLFSKMSGRWSSRLKVIFHDFPGGADGFELIAKFCYNNGTTQITPSNVVLLDCAAHFMEMGNNSSSSTPNLAQQAEKFTEGINNWTWPELLLALRECQGLLPARTSSVVLDKVMNCLIGRLALPTVSSPFTCSSDSSTFHLSRDSISTCSTRSSFSPTTWWFEDLSFLSVDLFDNVTRMMVVKKLDHALVFKFLIYYLRSRFHSFTEAKKCKMTEVAINLLSFLHRGALYCKGLFDVLLLSSTQKNINRCYKIKIEKLTGSMLDQATVNRLLVPSPLRKHYMYDVNLVLRLVKLFLQDNWITPDGLAKVAHLVDSYLIEVAPDLFLKPSKFAALASAVPDSARNSTDKLYQAIDIYLQVHSKICDKEKMRVLSALNYEKLSAESLRYLAQKSNSLSTTVLKDDEINQKTKLEKINAEKGAKQIIFYARKIKDEHSVDMKDLDAKLEGMRRRVKELEKVCTTIQSQISNVAKPMLRSPGKARSLPKLCYR